MSRSIQISMNEELLREVDADPETREIGRSAVIRRALELYLKLKRERAIDASYDRAYGGQGDEVFEEFADLLEAQTWPES